MTINQNTVLADVGVDKALHMGRRMILLAALAQNSARGLTYGSYSTLVFAIEQRMHVGRGLSTAGIALCVLTSGLTSAFVGVLIRRFGIRTVLIVGALLCGLGYLGLALSPNIWWFLITFLLLIGPGSALLGIAAPIALMANWFVTGRGRAIGLVNMPVVTILAAPLAAFLLPLLGLSGVYLVLSAITFAVLPALLFVINSPEQIGLHPYRHVMQLGTLAPAHHGNAAGLFRTLDYWLLGLAAAILAGGGVTILTHIVPMAIEQGVPVKQAAWLSSTIGLSGIFGSVFYGMLSDRIGGARGIAINAAIQALCWFALMAPLALLPRLAVTAVIGINIGGILPSLSTALSTRFGPAAMGAAVGSWTLMQLPFGVGLPPLAGYLFVRTGSYGFALLLLIGLYVAAVLLASIAARRHDNRLARGAAITPV